MTKTKRSVASVLLALVLITPVTCALGAQERTKVDEPAARAAASKRVPDGVVRSSELEKEHGRLVWSFDLARPGTVDVTEVQVDAMTGDIVGVAIETAADQAKEARVDKRRHGTCCARTTMKNETSVP